MPPRPNNDSKGPFGLDLRQVPAAFQLGNLALGAVDALEARRQDERVRQYNRAISYLDEGIRDVDHTLATMRAGQKPDWSAVSRQAAEQIDAAMAVLRTMGHTGVGRLPSLADFDVPIPTGGHEVGTGPTTAIAPQGTTQPGAWSNGGPQLTSVMVRMREARELIRRLRDAEAAVALERKAAGGLAGFGAANAAGGPTLLTYISLAMVGACAYHGYKRRGTIGGAVLWTLAPGFLGVLGGSIALAIAIGQGYGKKP